MKRIFILFWMVTGLLVFQSCDDDQEVSDIGSALSESEVNTILDIHAASRKAVGLDPMTWSTEVAESAQRWADVLSNDHCGQLIHSSSDFRNGYGENLSLGWGSLGAERAVTLWADEVNYYNYDANSCQSGQQCGHYTQMVWENSTEIGCAKAVCTQGGASYEVWVCQYNPAGNYIGQRPY